MSLLGGSSKRCTCIKTSTSININESLFFLGGEGRWAHLVMNEDDTVLLCRSILSQQSIKMNPDPDGGAESASWVPSPPSPPLQSFFLIFPFFWPPRPKPDFFTSDANFLFLPRSVFMPPLCRNCCFFCFRRCLRIWSLDLSSERILRPPAVCFGGPPTFWRLGLWGLKPLRPRPTPPPRPPPRPPRPPLPRPRPGR